MKKYFLLAAVLLSLTTFCQVKKKKTEAAPTQRELQEMTKEMEENMGIKMPSTKDIPSLSDKKIQEAFENEERLIPLRDAAKIAAIPKNLPDNRLGSYVMAVQSNTSTALKPHLKNMADKIYSYIKQDSKNNTQAGNMAAGLWMSGKPQIACYTMGKICTDDPANTDNLSNYAAMLSMLGAPHLAIPILNNLNNKFPKNSTILNNLGQAWFGLGEVVKAEKYLDTVIRIYANHAQANYTKSFIEESKGNKTAAVKAVKRSIKNTYTQEKEDRLKHLDYELNSDDLNWNFPMPQDPLGLEKFKWPALPKNIDESKVLEQEWDAFKKECDIKGEELQIKAQKANEDLNALMQRLQTNKISASDMAKIISPFAAKAAIKLKYLIDDKDGNLLNNYVTKQDAFINASIKIEEYEEIRDRQLEQNREKYKDQFGEGKDNPSEAACADDTKAWNAYLNAANTYIEQTANDYLNFLRRKISNEIYYYQYTAMSPFYEGIKVQAQSQWLGIISAIGRSRHIQFKNRNELLCQSKEADETEEKFTLQAFDDVACKYKSELNLKIIKITNNCSRMTSEFDFMFLKYVRKDDFERAEGDTYISSSYVISAEAGKDQSLGPFKVEAKIGVGIEFDFGRAGLEDVVMIGEVKAGLGTNVLDENIKTGSEGIGIIGKDAIPTTVEVGIEGRISIVSGKVSGGLTGLLQNIK